MSFRNVREELWEVCATNQQTPYEEVIVSKLYKSNIKPRTVSGKRLPGQWFGSKGGCGAVSIRKASKDVGGDYVVVVYVADEKGGALEQLARRHNTLKQAKEQGVIDLDRLVERKKKFKKLSISRL